MIQEITQRILKPAEHLIIIFAVNGERISVECDEFRKGKEELWLYRVEKKTEEEEDERDLIAAFQLKNIIGWEQVR